MPLRSKICSLLARVSSPAKAVAVATNYIKAVKGLAVRPCVVLDIDGTVLQYDAKDVPRCFLYFTKFVAECRRCGIGVFFVTARRRSRSAAAETLKQLRKCNLLPCRALYMRPQGWDYRLYKKDARERIRRQGNTILMVAGDQWADLLPRSERRLKDDVTYLGNFGEDGALALKLPSEFRET